MFPPPPLPTIIFSNAPPIVYNHGRLHFGNSFGFRVSSERDEHFVEFLLDFVAKN